MRRRLEQALGEAARLYQHIQQEVRARDEFLSVAAHELKTPLTSLRGFAQLAVRPLRKGRELDTGQVCHALRVIDRQSELSRLVGQLLDASLLESGKLVLARQDVDLAALAERAAAAAQATTDRHHIGVRASPSVPVVVDPTRVAQVVTSLVDNAVKYSPEGGPIDIDVSRPALGTAQLTVTDRGIGIPPVHRQRIFDRFYRAHEDGYLSGLGLGLYVSRQIVELHGGELRAEFPAEGGARFVVALPACDPDPGPDGGAA